MKNTYVINMKIEAEYAIKANSEEEALELADEWFYDNPYCECKVRIDNSVKPDAEV